MKKDNDKKISAAKKSVSKKKSKVEEKNIVGTDNSSQIVETNDSLSINSKEIIGYVDRFRSKILITLLLFMILTPLAFYFSGLLLSYINKPYIVTGNKLNIFTLMGGFMLRFKVSAAATLLLLTPLIIYQIWSIASNSVQKSSKIFSGVIITIAVILFYGGVAISLFILLPLMVEIMLSFNPGDMLSTVGADSYLSFSLLLCLSMGIIFEIPIIVLVLTRMGIITPEMLSSKRRYAIVIIWIIAAIATPPDVLSQAIVAIPLMIIFEISILISKYVVYREKN
ncbi:MAG: twin-arginine translocase subunit TatC [Leptospirales bacterium]|nr:twin-arginine translocase subunit TatC [Leptospirales bacterium]